MNAPFHTETASHGIGHNSAAVDTLASRAMMAKVSIRLWSAKKTDKRVSREVADAHGTTADAGNYNKRLVARDALEKVASIAGQIRQEHYSRTLPWSDDGRRILSARGFTDYVATIDRLIAEFDAAADEFAASYPAVKDAARAALNGLFNESDYPPESDIRARFKAEKTLENMPSANDFRVELDSAQVADIRASIDRDTRAAFESATRDVWRRVAETVGHMAERLRLYKPGNADDKAKNPFHASLVENVRDLAGLLPGLNIADDPALSAIADRIKADLCQDDAKELRTNDSARESVAAAAEAILADVSVYMA